MTDYEIRPLEESTWDDFAALVERGKGLFSGCRCIWFHPDCEERGQGADGNRALKRKLVEQGAAHAALVFDGDEAVAWAEYGTVEELPNIHHRKEWEAGLVTRPDCRVTCIFVDKRYRKKGLAEVALRGALDLIAQQGGGTVEGYPHDIPTDKKVSASFIYNGTRRMYERVGFTFSGPRARATP
jgi:GNAT superfamily N-acetyltransferase